MDQNIIAAASGIIANNPEVTRVIVVTTEGKTTISKNKKTNNKRVTL